MKMGFEDIVRLMPTDMLASATANNSIADMYKYAIGTAELAFRIRFAHDTGREFVPDVKAFYELRDRVKSS